MKRIFVKPRVEVLGNSEHPSCMPNMKTIQDFGIPPDYQKNGKDIIKFFVQINFSLLLFIIHYSPKLREKKNANFFQFSTGCTSAENDCIAKKKAL